MNTKYVEGLLEVLKLEGAYPKRLHRTMEGRFKRRKEEWIR